MDLPKWLDDLIFRDLHAVYSPSYGNMTNIDDDMEKTLNYLGTYFPRSYVESYCIFSEFFKKNPSCFTDKEELSIYTSVSKQLLIMESAGNTYFQKQKQSNREKSTVRVGVLA